MNIFKLIQRLPVLLYINKTQMSIADIVVAFFTAPNRRPSEKVAITIIVLFCLYTTNDLLGFSYYYRMNRKVELIEKLGKIANDSTLDSACRADAAELRHRVAQKEPSYFAWWRSSWDFLTGRLKSKNTNRTPPIIDTTTNIAANASIRNEVLFYASAGGLYAITGMIMFFLLLFRKSRATIFQKLSGSLFLLLTFSIISTTLYTLMDFIPALWNEWAYNYILNSILQLGTIAVIAYYGRPRPTA